MKRSINEDDDPSSEEVSKSQKKREATALQQLGERLLTLSDKQLSNIDLPENLYQAVILAKGIKSRSGLKRQLQYIGKLMRNIDSDPIEIFFEELDNQSRKQNKQFHQLESWRDRLVLEGDAVLSEVKDAYPLLDMQRMRQLIRNAKNIKNEKLSLKAKREIFQYLKELSQ